MKKLLFLLMFLGILGCSEDVHDKKSLLLLTLEHDKNASVILPESIDKGIKCSDYGEGCKSAHMVKILDLETIFVEFDTQANAKKGATKINAMYSLNWVFDDVVGEPILEKFFARVYEAKYAKKQDDKLKN
jgi:hypothetical protein